MNKEERCGNCKFWEEYQRGSSPKDFGNCKRHAPMIKNITITTDRYNDSVTGSWPQTHRMNWCGDWEQDLHIME